MTVYENRSLFSDYYLQERLTDHDRWAVTVTAAYTRARKIYAGVHSRLDTLNEAQTEEEFIKPVLRDVLGFAYDVQVSVQNRGRRNVPDYALFTSESARRDAQQHRTSISTAPPPSPTPNTGAGRSTDRVTPRAKSSAMPTPASRSSTT